MGKDTKELISDLIREIELFESMQIIEEIFNALDGPYDYVVVNEELYEKMRNFLKIDKNQQRE